MWQVDGALAFHAETAGATRVTGVDLMAPTEAFEAEHARRGSAVRFVRGDLHDEATIEAVGPHDVVWCSGVVYHAPHPVLTLQRLRSITGEVLVVASETLRERRPRRSAVFAPAPGSHPAHTQALDPLAGYAGWWWGLTPSALRAIAEAAGFRAIEEHRTRWHTTLVLHPIP